ncbi:uncharacterized protein LOC123259139 isoform X2 [Cotesia glomerata]|uniref:uncharacterized protein LOC123259139 isoform X2 n=1 Tax=Cotesia glomerata TaxID=32391 RepID=UPI001D016C8B|nr:uncharacterized protein LOC123259139 isoform X2 [Cotesia glomerata]
MGNVCACRSKDSQINAGSILDRVISQASDEDQCLLYRLANYKKGGELIEAFNRGGQSEVEQVIRGQFGILMYNNGKGQTINRAEYLRWKFRDLEQVVLPIEASLSRFDPLARWTDHEACWQMQYRGSLGETLLHVLIICDTKTHTRIARVLIKCFPRLAIDAVEGEEYLGASALHLAIAYNNNELVQDLIEAKANVSQRAIGSFFLPRDQQQQRVSRNTDYEGLAYLGEYPLAWAACCANESVYNLLLDSGANPDDQDSFGNMILHMVVVCDKLDMFGYALRHPKFPASNGIANTAGFTPLTLACQLGRAEVFREMLELSAREFWRYSNITCSAYPLNALDTLLPDGRTNWNSALFIILNGTKAEHLDMLDGGIIQRLLEEKWKTFARLQFLKRLIILVFHLTSLSLAVYLRPGEIDADLMGWPEEWTEIGRTIAECITVLGVLGYILFQLGGEVVNIGLISFLKQLSHEPAKFIFLLSNILILACIPCRLAADRHLEDAILVVAVPGSWFLLMFFAGAVRLTGPFVTMVYSMITGDMLTFGIIYMVVLFGFSQSFHFLYKGFPRVSSSLFQSYHSTWMALFQITLGDYSYSDLSDTTYPNLSKTVFAIFMVLVPILLLNMLIAMMGNTYAHVIEQSEKEWMKQWAKIVVSLERAVSQKDAHNYLQEYSIKLGPGDDPNNPASEQRGVMVIKSKSKTRARQRKGALANWKRVGKVTINALRKRGMTGEELRCIMWGRASISTPVRASPHLNEREISGLPAASVMGGASVPPQPLVPAPTLPPGFGDALTAALDVMAFAQDIDPSSGAEGITSTGYLISDGHQSKGLPMTITESSISPTTVIEMGNPISGVARVDQNRLNGPPPEDSAKSDPDPLLNLVIASESPESQHEALLRMAEEARISSEVRVKLDASVLESFGLGLAPAEILAQAPVTEKDKLFEESSDDICGSNLLGTDSRLRRIKSASMRYKKETNSVDENKQNGVGVRLFDYYSSSEENPPSGVILTNGCVNESTSKVKKTTVSSASSSSDMNRENKPERVKSDVKDARWENEKLETATRDEKNHPQNVNKNHKRRAKTAKNRVSPKEVNTRGSNDSQQKETTSTPASPTDPLEPWSTRGISDMNTILAWRENGMDSP